MTFQIHALPAEIFTALHTLSDDELVTHSARRVIADANPGYPCRVSLQDAEQGETLILLNHISIPGNTPFRASHAIYVREGVTTANPAPGEVPDALSRRLLSIRGFDADHMLRDADVVEGQSLEKGLIGMFDTPEITEIHIHNAKQGCYAARATRA